ncbi:MAG TPA: hypothetical protein VF486_17910, partial [Actinomycetes bacterium]
IHRRIATGAAAIGLAALALPLLAAPASAHEERTVGKYHFAVGFGDEPAYQGEKNSVQLFLHDAKDKPVTDLGDTLEVDVSSESAPGKTLSLSMEPFFEVGEFGTPGDYRAWFIPTAPGKYTFHFTGSVKGQKVDERFTSSPTTFAEVADPAKVEFPAVEPTPGQLGARLDREVPRLDSATKKARDDAGGARTLAIVGIVVGVIGIGVGGFALGRRASGPRQVADEPARAGKS